MLKYARMLLAITLVSMLATVSYAKDKVAKDIAPVVTIISPASPFPSNQPKIDITVSFKAETGNCKYINLVLDGKVVATYQNKASVKEGTHTFKDVDISAIINQGAPLICSERSTLENPKTRHRGSQFRQITF